jgi:hypothetical protein
VRDRFKVVISFDQVPSVCEVHSLACKLKVLNDPKSATLSS